MSKLRRKYSKAERLEIVNQSLEEDTSVTDLADRYGISPTSIYRWRSRYYKEEGIERKSPEVQQMSEVERENVRLKKQLREAQLERDILKKAINIFSKSDGKSTIL